VRTVLLAAALGWTALGGPTVAVAQLEDQGIGFVMRSEDFGEACTTDPGNLPVVYHNLTKHSVEVSLKVVNTGQTILFVRNVVFPPTGPQRRPRVMRITLAPAEGLRIKSQGEPCAWLAVIRPH
jgi:hypothetical protein